MPKFMTLSEAAKHIGVHRSTMARMVGRNEVPALRLPSGAVRIDAADFKAWRAAHRTDPIENTPMTLPASPSAKLESLEHEIALTERALADATRANHAAGVELARAPSNHDALKAAREAAKAVAEIESDLDMLRKARVAAREADDADAMAAGRAQAIEHMKALDVLIAERQEAAERVDAALAELKAVLQSWMETGRAVADEARGFFKLTVADQRRMSEYSGGASSMVDVASNAIAAEVDDACRGMNIHHTMTFNYLRQHAGQPEMVAAASESSAGMLQARVREIAKQRGLLQ